MKLLLTHIILCSILLSSSAGSAILYQNDFNVADDLNDWTFSGDGTGDWAISEERAGIGLVAPGGWGDVKNATLTSALSADDVAIRSTFNAVGNESGYLRYEVRQTAGLLSGVTFEVRRYGLSIYDAGDLIDDYVITSDLTYNTWRPGFTNFIFNATVVGSTYSVTIFDVENGLYVKDNEDHTVFSGTLSTALSAGNISLSYKTYTDSPIIYDYQLSEAGLVPEPGTGVLMLAGLLLSRSVWRKYGLT